MDSGSAKLFHLLDEETRKQDHISHFILRLAFCQSPEQTKWFIQHELDLFKLRFESLKHDKIEFLRRYNFNLTFVSENEKESLRSRLVPSNVGISHGNLQTKAFFKVSELWRSFRVWGTQI